MPAGRSVRRRVAGLSKRTNRVIAPLLGRLPGFGELHHVGRVSGTPYQTPLRLVGNPADGEGYFVLTYGPDTDWYLNLTVNRATFHTHTGSYEVGSPRLVEPSEAEVPQQLRTTLRLLGIDNLVQITLRPTTDLDR